MHEQLTEAQQDAIAMLTREPMKYDQERVRVTVLRNLKAKGIVELEYDARGDLVWRLVNRV